MTTTDLTIEAPTAAPPSGVAASGGAPAGVVTAEAPARIPTWVPVCRVDDVTPDRGVAALVHGHQVAVFLLSPLPGQDGPTEVYAIDNRDPYSGANVLARGLVGSAGDRPTVASPIYKERFDLRDGTCLDGDRHVRAWPARIVGGRIEVAVDRTAVGGVAADA